VPPLVEIGLTDLPKSGGAMAPPALPGTTPLHGSYMFDTMRIQTSKSQRVSFFPFKKTRVDRDFCVQRKT